MKNLEFRRGSLRFVGGNPKRQIPNPKDKNGVFGFWDFGICPNLKSQSWDLGFGFLGFGIWDMTLGFGIWVLGIWVLGIWVFGILAT